MPGGVQQAYLQGGPCDGKTVDLPPNQPAPDRIDCGGGIYKNPGTSARHDGALIFKYAGMIPPPSNIGHDTHALQGWGDLRRTFNRGLPTALRHTSKLTNASLRQIRRHHKVKG